jgi:uncharacterized membrane protein
MYERQRRSILKAISWRLTGTIDTFILSFLVTGQIKFAFYISGFEVFTKICLYFLHERIWNKIGFGKEKYKVEYEI